MSTMIKKERGINSGSSDNRLRIYYREPWDGGKPAWQGELEGTRFSQARVDMHGQANGRTIANRELPQV